MKEVRYGESGYYKYLIFAGGAPCTNTVFGDPIPGVYKHCYYRDLTLVPTATPDLNATALAYANATATVSAAKISPTAVAANATATVVAAAQIEPRRPMPPPIRSYLSMLSGFTIQQRSHGEYRLRATHLEDVVIFPNFAVECNSKKIIKFCDVTSS